TSDCGASAANGPSRRAVLTAGAALAGVAAELPGGALAQGAADAALDRLQRARRILLKGGVVLTLDRQVGDFTQADVLIEDGMIDMGTTTVVDTSQVCHTPEHSDAGIRALEEAGIRAVYAYSRGAGPAAQYPQDIVRLQRTSFSSKDQLLSLALGGGLDPKLFAYAREVGVRTVSHGVNNATEHNLLELGRAGLLREG